MLSLDFSFETTKIIRNLVKQPILYCDPDKLIETISLRESWVEKKNNNNNIP